MQMQTCCASHIMCLYSFVKLSFYIASGLEKAPDHMPRARAARIGAMKKRPAAWVDCGGAPSQAARRTPMKRPAAARAPAAIAPDAVAPASPGVFVDMTDVGGDDVILVSEIRGFKDHLGALSACVAICKDPIRPDVDAKKARLVRSTQRGGSSSSFASERLRWARPPRSNSQATSDVRPRRLCC